MVEIFSGSCRLTASLRSLGFDAWGVDHIGRKLAAVSPAYVELDLTLDKDVEKLFKLLEHPLLIFAHMSPPSDTANRARDVSIQGGPLPLRSAAFPLGLPALGERHPRDIARVEAANKLYAVCARVALLLTEKSIPVEHRMPPQQLLLGFPGHLRPPRPAGRLRRALCELHVGRQAAEGLSLEVIPSGALRAARDAV